jgi:hypothetical protein
MPDVVVVSDEQGAGIVFFRSSAFTDFFFHEYSSNNVISSMAPWPFRLILFYFQQQALLARVTYSPMVS